MTTPHDAIRLVPVFAEGSALGALFFGGLWWTLRRVLTARLSAFWLVSSLVVRVGLVLVGFLVVAGDQWARWLVVLAGFIAARVVISRLLPAAATAGLGTFPSGTGRHAP